MSRVGIDLDGVLYDFQGAFKRHCLSLGADPKQFCSPAVRWEFFKDWGYSQKTFIDLCDESVNAGKMFAEGGVLDPTGKEALERLRAAGHTVVIVTDRAFGKAGQSEVNTMRWLADNEIPYDEIHFGSDKTQFDLDYMVDDKPSNITALDIAGTKVAVYTQPWNAGVLPATRFYSVKTLRAFSNWVILDAPEPPRPAMSLKPDLVLVSSVLDGEVRSTSSTGAEKGTKLARYDLLPVGPLQALAEHYGRGSLKYADRNWERGYEWSKSYAAMQRHSNAFWGGEDIDPETDSPHLAAVAWHAFAMLEYGETHPEFDDRPTSAVEFPPHTDTTGESNA